MILVIDDEEAVLGTARMALEQTGFRVESADSGRAGIASFEALHPDLVLLDLLMPGLDGIAVYSRIRTMPAGTHTPVLIMIEGDDVESLNCAYEAGATDFLTKPLNLTLLPHRLRYLLRAARTLSELRARGERLGVVQRIAKLGYFEWNMKGDQIACSPQAGEIFGLPLEEDIYSWKAVLQQILPEDRDLVVRTVQDAIRGRRHYTVEHRILRADGEVRTVYEEGEFVDSESREGGWLIGTIQDITDRRRAGMRNRQLALFDGVTGLPNRTLVRRQLAQALGTAQRHNRVLAVLALDIDHFGRVNKTLGHSGGDDLLRLVGHRLQHCVRESDTVGLLLERGTEVGDAVARVADDEFVIVLTEIENAEDAAQVARRIQDALAPSCNVGGSDVRITASIGISVFPNDGSNGESLLRQAEAAMCKAKSRGRDRYQFSSESINTRVFERFALEHDLRKALQIGQFELHYQPKLRLSDRSVIGAEGLVRWRHPDLGIISPGHFIPLAEDSGLIIPLGEWILREACNQARAWQEDGLPGLVVSVNLSALQMRRGDLAQLVGRVISETGLKAELLELELTEPLLREDPDRTLRITKNLRALGVGLSIDDFGTGCSALSYLKRFFIQTVKIDQSLMRDIASGPGDSAIVRAILALARSLHLNVVAEGVENENQLRFLSTHNCDAAQGYYFSRPLGADDFAQWIRQHASPDS